VEKGEREEGKNEEELVERKQSFRKILVKLGFASLSIFSYYIVISY